MWIWMLVIVGCGDDKDLTDPADGDADTDADTDSDADADTDSDTDADTSNFTTGATGPTSDTAPVEPTGPTGDTAVGGCLTGTSADLEIRWEARDAGGACVVCTGAITAAVVVENPCPADLPLDLTNGCLVESWDVSMGATGLGVGNTCGGQGTTVAIPGMGSIEDSQGFGSLGAGNWLGTARVPTFPVDTIVSGQFQVQ